MKLVDTLKQLVRRVDSRHPADTFDERFVSSAALIVVGGCGRSGTTLVRAILDSHPRICCGPESELLLAGPIKLDILSRKFGLATAEIESMYQAAGCRQQFIEAFSELCCRRAGKQRWAEKTPKNVLYLPQIFKAFPQARFIHVLRDGRDVVCSLRTHPRHRVENGQLVPLNTWKPIDECARRWREDVEASRPFWNDPRFYVVRYENLVLDPQPALEDLMKFIAEPWDDSLLNHTESESPFRDVTTFPQNPEILEPVTSKALGRWQTDLTEADKSQFKRNAGELLCELGYAADDRW